MKFQHQQKIKKKKHDKESETRSRFLYARKIKPRWMFFEKNKFKKPLNDNEKDEDEEKKIIE